jgi:DNA uptake protein ComE-like DNA-binding protein
MSVSELTSEQLVMLDDPKWRRRNSRWRLFIWFTAGLYGTFVLWYVAAKARSKKAIIAAGVSTALGVGFMIFTSAQPTLTPEQQAAVEGTTRAATANENLLTAFSLALVAFNIWMSFYLQKDWLLWVVAKKSKGSWVEENLKIKTVTRSDLTAQRNRQAKIDSGSKLFGDASDLIADAPAPSMDTPPKLKPLTSTDVLPLDVNQASISDLLKIPGLSEAHAEQIVIERKSRGGFKSFEELRLTLQLKPHEIAKLEGMFDFPSSNSGPTFGRVLDV